MEMGSIEGFQLSPQQRRLWSLQQKSPNYRAQCAIRLEGDFDQKALKAALQKVVDRHEILRTTFQHIPGLKVPVMEIDSSGIPEWHFLDLSDRESRQQQVEIEKWFAQEKHLPFDLERGPLLRATLIAQKADQHLLLVSLPSLCADATTLRNLVYEISNLYEISLQGKEVLDEPVQYVQFSEWQHELLREEEEAEIGRNYWLEQDFADFLTLTLPFEKEASEKSVFAQKLLPFGTESGVAAKIEAIAQKYNTSVETFLLSCFQILIWRLTGKSKIVIGRVCDGRKYEELHDGLGLFAKWLPMPCHFEDDLRLDEVLTQVDELTQEAYEWQEYFVLEQDTGSSTEAYFSIGFEFEEQAAKHWRAGVCFSIYKQYSCTDRSDVKLSCIRTGDALSTGFYYDRNRFHAREIQRLAGQFDTLLKNAIEDPRALISELELLSETERCQLLIDYNDTKRDFPADHCIHNLFEVQASATPDSIAVVFEDQQLTYQQLNQRTTQLAHYLRALGVGTEVPVGIYVERSLEMIVGLLGILKSGGAYVPLDPAYPKERLAYMLKDAQVPVLVTADRLAATLSGYGAKVVCLDSDWHEITRQSTENPCSGTMAENLAYIIYTSGSTGNPKGVAIEHRQALNYLRGILERLATEPRANFATVSTLAADLGNTMIFPSLCTGGCLHVIPQTCVADPEAMADYCLRHRIDCLKIVPSHLAALLNSLNPERIMPHRCLVVGGEASHWDWIQRLCLLAPDCTILNHYGPTESTTGVLTYQVESGQTVDYSLTLPLGRPIANTQVYLLDSRLQPVPIGVPGELHIGGAGLARYYLNRPELVAEKFVPNSFGTEPGGRLYRTGDLARYLPDGNIEFLGRIDHQVKLRGYRIELGEIEAILSQHPAVQRAVVHPQSDEFKDKYLVGYVVVNPQYRHISEQMSEQDLQAEQIAKWQMVFDGTFSQISSLQDPTAGLTGWNSSYTGQPFPAEEVHEQVSQTVERILSLQPTRVLEIGSGTGLLLFRIAPHCDYYCGTDFSQESLSYIQNALDTPQNNLPQVTLRQKEADDFKCVKMETFDTVIMDSVIQYFPSVDYLLRVLEGAVETVEPSGAIFVGDVRSYALLSAFHASVQLHRASPSHSKAQLRQYIQKQLSQENELVIDPAFFTSLQQHLPQISSVEVQLKRGRYHNELTKFRYDVVIHVGPEVPSTLNVPWIRWDETFSSQSIRRLLEETRPEVVGITKVPNARLLPDLQILEWLVSDNGPQTVGEIREILQNTEEIGIDPESLWALADRLPYEIQINWSDSGAGRYYDVVFRRCPATGTGKSTRRIYSFPRKSPRLKRWSDYANDPLQGTLITRLVPQLRAFLAEKLPNYMVPSAFVILSALTLTPNGKVDRNALPVPEKTRPEIQETFVAPRTPTEEKIAEIWAEILGIEKIGIHDDFFELGGHSLLATQVIYRIRETFDVNLPLRNLFETPTVCDLALAVTQLQMEQEDDQEILQMIEEIKHLSD